MALTVFPGYVWLSSYGWAWVCGVGICVVGHLSTCVYIELFSMISPEYFAILCYSGMFCYKETNAPWSPLIYWSVFRQHGILDSQFFRTWVRIVFDHDGRRFGNGLSESGAWRNGKGNKLRTSVLILFFLFPYRYFTSRSRQSWNRKVFIMISRASELAYRKPRQQQTF